MVDFGDSMDVLSNKRSYLNAAYIAAGYSTAEIGRNVLESRISMYLPDESYGLMSMVVHDRIGKKQAVYGGALHSVHMLGQRLGAVETITGLGA